MEVFGTKILGSYMEQWAILTKQRAASSCSMVLYKYSHKMYFSKIKQPHVSSKYVPDLENSCMKHCTPYL